MKENILASGFISFFTCFAVGPAIFRYVAKVILQSLQLFYVLQKIDLPSYVLMQVGLQSWSKWQKKLLFQIDIIVYFVCIFLFVMVFQFFCVFFVMYHDAYYIATCIP